MVCKDRHWRRLLASPDPLLLAKIPRYQILRWILWIHKVVVWCGSQPVFRTIYIQNHPEGFKYRSVSHIYWWYVYYFSALNGKSFPIYKRSKKVLDVLIFLLTCESVRRLVYLGFTISVPDLQVDMMSARSAQVLRPWVKRTRGIVIFIDPFFPPHIFAVRKCASFILHTVLAITIWV